METVYVLYCKMENVMKIFFPKKLVEASKINCEICLAIAEKRGNEVSGLLKLAEEARNTGLAELSRQFVTPVDREDIASLFVMLYEVAFYLGETAEFASRSGVVRTAAEYLETAMGNCDVIHRIMQGDSLPTPDILLNEYGLSRASALKILPPKNNIVLYSVYSAAKKCEELSFRIIDYILRSSIKNN